MLFFKHLSGFLIDIFTFFCAKSYSSLTSKNERKRSKKMTSNVASILLNPLSEILHKEITIDVLVQTLCNSFSIVVYND